MCFQCELFAADLVDTGLTCEEYADHDNSIPMNMPTTMTGQQTNAMVSRNQTSNFAGDTE